MKFSFAASAFALLSSTSILRNANAQLREAATSPLEMVVSANNLATDAGKAILAAGGTAVDAMIAVQTVLGLVEPQSSGIAGGSFVVYYDGTTDQLTTYDAREKAPAGATETRFQNEDGASLDFNDAWQSALSVGVAGVPQLLEDMHGKYGSLPWADLFEEAKRLATDGFEFTHRTEDNANELLEMNDSCEDGERLFFRDPVAFDYFINAEDCTAKPAGTFVTNPEYAATMDAIATDGASAFYTGDIAEDIIAKVAADRNPTGDALITLEDMMNYDIIERTPVCKTYRDMYDICGMGPPSSGALALGQIFGVLENFELPESSDDPDTVHLFTQAMRLAFADRNLYVGDPDFITVPVEGMLNSTYLSERAALIDVAMDMGSATPGAPPGTYDPSAPQMRTYEGGTSHISIVDQYGNAISMTTTVESYFGSGLMVRGFLLNNQITDFSFENVDGDGVPIANRVQPSKRPRSSMSPTIVLNPDGTLAYLAGSPGGFRIIGYVSSALMLMIDYGYDPQEAANTPHKQNQNGDTELETPTPGITTEYDIEALTEALTLKGHTVVERGGETSGLSLIEVLMEDGSFLGGADPRRDGTAGGRASLETPEEMTEVPVEEETEGPAVEETTEGPVEEKTELPVVEEATTAPVEDSEDTDFGVNEVSKSVDEP